MKPSQPLKVTRPVRASSSLSTTIPQIIVIRANRFSDYIRFNGRARSPRFPVSVSSSSSGRHVPPTPVVQSSAGTSSLNSTTGKLELIEESLEKVIYRCRFMTLLGVLGSLIGSFLCFIKGCTVVVAAFNEYIVNRARVIMLLVEAIDVYLLGTVMLVFGMGLYELFVSNLGSAKPLSEEKVAYRSNFFGLFTLKERPKWLDVKTVNELKTKLGHVIVMLLLIGFFEKSKKAVIHSPVDLLCFSASVLLSSLSLFLLSKLNDAK